MEKEEKEKEKIRTKAHLRDVARATFYNNSPQYECRNEEVSEFAHTIVSIFSPQLMYCGFIEKKPTIRAIARATYRHWCALGWRKVKIEGERGKKVVWKKDLSISVRNELF